MAEGVGADRHLDQPTGLSGADRAELEQGADGGRPLSSLAEGAEVSQAEQGWGHGVEPGQVQLTA